MASDYYKPCPELDTCNALIEKYWDAQEYGKLFDGHLPLAEAGYPLAECQIGYFYLESLGVSRDMEKALYWTRRSAEHGDRDGQFNLGWFYETGTAVPRDTTEAARWYRAAAAQGQCEAIEKCQEFQSE